MYRFLLFETVPRVEAYTLQVVRINHRPDKTRSYTVKGDTHDICEYFLKQVRWL